MSNKGGEGLLVEFHPGAALKGPYIAGVRRIELTDFRGERLQIMLTPEELDALDSWRFSNRMPSRAAAVRELLKRGLGGEAPTDGNGGRTHSRDYRVLSRRGANGNGSGNGTSGRQN